MASLIRSVTSLSRSFKASSAPLIIPRRLHSLPADLSHSLLLRNDESLLEHLHQTKVASEETDSSTVKIRALVEEISKELKITMEVLDKLKLIDTIERLGIGHLFEEEIKILLEGFLNGEPDEDLHTAALRFRLLRHRGYMISSDFVFAKFTDINGKLKESLSDDILGLLSLYEASYLGAKEEVILSQAMEFCELHLKKTKFEGQLGEQVSEALELPRHKRMARLEARRYIKEYGQQTYHSLNILELAILDYNEVQSLHQTELTQVTRWWKELGLIDNLSFVRDRFLDCFIWTIGILPEPKYSSCRIELSKAIAILLVIDDIYDTYGTIEELLLFTSAIQRWDLHAIEELPEYMKTCYTSLYNTIDEIGCKILKEHGLSILPILKSTWISMIEGRMLEAKWVSTKKVPTFEEYIENSVCTTGAYMALTHIFLLIGQGVTEDNLKLMVKPYPKLFSSSGIILRLWDDLGTSKEEQERGGDIASSIQLYMRENDNITSENEARKKIIQLINGLWKDLNEELFLSQNVMPMTIIKAGFNMARVSHVVYHHDEDSYHLSVDKYVKTLFYSHAD